MKASIPKPTNKIGQAKDNSLLPKNLKPTKRVGIDPLSKLFKTHTNNNIFTKIQGWEEGIMFSQYKITMKGNVLKTLIPERWKN